MAQTAIVNLKMMRDGDFIPVYGSEEAAGADLRAAVGRPVTIAPHSTEMVPTGIAVSIPDGCFGALYARSGLATKRGLRPANAVGVIDSDYTGEIIVALHNDGDVSQTIEPGERIAQLVIQPYVKAEFHQVDELDKTERGAGGFGSTGTE